jgi:hypothetical protein
LSAAGLLFKYRNDTGKLKAAIVFTISAAVAHGLAMAIGFTSLSLGYVL